MEPAGSSWQGAARPSVPPRCGGAVRPGERAESVTLLVWPAAGQSEVTHGPEHVLLSWKSGLYVSMNFKLLSNPNVIPQNSIS